MRWLVVAPILLGLGVAACSYAGVPEVPAGADGTRDAVLVAGREVYIERCANCHGDDGGGGRGSRLSGGASVRRFAKVSAQMAVVAEGVRAMPAFRDVLKPDEIEAVTRFTREVL